MTVAKYDERFFAVQDSTYFQIQVSRFYRQSYTYTGGERGNEETNMERDYEISHLDSICSFALGRSTLKDNRVEFLDET